MFNNPLFRTLASLKLSMALLILFAVAIAKATFIENDLGADGARALVYNARWFEILLALFCLNLLMVLLKGIPYKPRRTGSVIVHISMIVILVSAGISRWFGYEGVMHIREGESSSEMWSREPHLQLIHGDETVTAPVRLYTPGQSLSKTMKIGDDSYRVSIDAFWPDYEQIPVEAESGPRAMDLRVGGSNGEVVALEHGQSQHVRGTQYKFADDLGPTAGESSPWGDLRVRVGEESTSLPMDKNLPLVVEVAGWTFEVVEFQAAFKVGGGTDFNSPMTNPGVKLEITDPDGGKGTRYLFAYSPDFAMNHSGTTQDFSNLDVAYNFDAGIVFAIGSDGELRGRASMPLRANDAGRRSEIAPGTEFTVATGAIYGSANESVQFEVRGVFEHLGYEDGSGSDENASDFAFITVTGPNDVEGRAKVRVNDERSVQVTLGDENFGLRIEPIRIDLPYSIYLEDFLQLNYPGSMNPAGYESHVLLSDEEKGIQKEPVRIYMNHPLTHRGFKHFQSSFHGDLKGTILSVNYDPGKLPTYFGYILISLGFVLIFIRDLIWPRKDQDMEGNNHDA